MAHQQTEFTVRELTEETWPAFDALVERDGGVWGGCWCIAFHLDPEMPKGYMRPHREAKQKLVCQGRALAALVFEGETAVGWCQFGRTEDLPNIKNRKNYEAELTQLPDWRITCFYVGKGYRKRGVANLALKHALKMIAEKGGGIVEAYPDDVEGKKASSSFLWGGTTQMFEKAGFDRQRMIGKNQCVMTLKL